MQKAENCILLIQSMYPSFHRVEKKIADYILENSEEVVTLSISELAKNLEVAESSIVRFCKILHLGGFGELKLNLACRPKEKPVLPFGNVKKDDSTAEILDKVLGASIQVLSETRDFINHKKFGEAVECIRNANIIIFCGMYTSSTIVHDAYMRLYRIGYPVFCFTDPYEAKIAASMLDENCVVLGVSHTGRTKETIETLRLAKENGAKVIALTSFVRSPILDVADISLVICSSASEGVMEAVSSRISHIAVMDALCTCLGISRYEQTTKRIEKNSEIINKMRFE